MIDGISPDAEVVTNSKGGKQSKAIGAFHLVDPDFLYGFYEHQYQLANPLIKYMSGDISKDEMTQRVLEQIPDALIQIAKVLEYGASRYSPNNWRLIPEEDHMNHALIHLYALEKEDKQDDHLGHFLTRLMMVYATDKSVGFDYTKPMKVEKIFEDLENETS